MDVSLRPVADQDVAAFWANHQGNRPDEATSAHQEAFAARWRSALNNRHAPIETIVVGGQAVGYIAYFRRKDLPEISYELGRLHWGKGFATAALRQFLGEIAERQLHARAAKDDAASIRVLQKCGFSIVGGSIYRCGRPRARGVHLCVPVSAATVLATLLRRSP
ncbi:MAG TPA: GNAT family N-acetyltransferase [Steroidobacteraceae bacterium]|nr:GNAT family N-acetyltransferase [Steroidobacteraceae bacterium]